MAQVLGLMSVIIIPTIVWAVTLQTTVKENQVSNEAMFKSHLYRIEQNEKTNTKIKEKIDRIDANTMHTLIEIEKLKK